MELIWLPEARADIQRLFDFLIEANPAAAGRAVRAISSGADLNLLGSSCYVPLPPSTAPSTVSHAQYRAVLAVCFPIRVRAVSTHPDQRGRVSASAVLIC